MLQITLTSRLLYSVQRRGGAPLFWPDHVTTREPYYVDARFLVALNQRAPPGVVAQASSMYRGTLVVLYSTYAVQYSTVAVLERKMPIHQTRSTRSTRSLGRRGVSRCPCAAILEPCQFPALQLLRASQTKDKRESRTTRGHWSDTCIAVAFDFEHEESLQHSSRRLRLPSSSRLQTWPPFDEMRRRSIRQGISDISSIYTFYISALLARISEDGALSYCTLLFDAR